MGRKAQIFGQGKLQEMELYLDGKSNNLEPCQFPVKLLSAKENASLNMSPPVSSSCTFIPLTNHHLATEIPRVWDVDIKSVLYFISFHHSNASSHKRHEKYKFSKAAGATLGIVFVFLPLRASGGWYSLRYFDAWDTPGNSMPVDGTLLSLLLPLLIDWH